MTPTQYSLAFAINAIGFIGASQFSATLSRRFGVSRVVSIAVASYTAMAVLLFVITAAGVAYLGCLDDVDISCVHLARSGYSFDRGAGP